MSTAIDQMLREITALSHTFGTPDFVKGGGGNTSVQDGRHVVGQALGHHAVLPGAGSTFVAMDRARLRKCLFEPGDPRRTSTAARRWSRM
jgi:rhamnose utilization protein RhaD (predicted bifunctional aldolase and dehydrogenase)